MRGITDLPAAIVTIVVCFHTSSSAPTIDK
jgi:hypothetical protein